MKLRMGTTQREGHRSILIELPDFDVPPELQELSERIEDTKELVGTRLACLTAIASHYENVQLSD